METVELLKRKIKTVNDLQSLVKTMKALAAVNIRQYERAVSSLSDYNRTIEMGLQVVLQTSTEIMKKGKSKTKDLIGAIVFGTDQGMCGQLNDQVVSYAISHMNKIGIKDDRRRMLAVGMRASIRLENAGETVEETLTVPGSLSSVTPMVQDVLSKIEDWNKGLGIDRVVLFYNRYHFRQAFHNPSELQLLPVNFDLFQHLKNKKWPSRALPSFTMDPDRLFSSLIRQYLFVSLFRAFVESMASENASRTASMQRAEKNISDHLEELNAKFHQQRQMSITEELLDIVSGYEALSS